MNFTLDQNLLEKYPDTIIAFAVIKNVSIFGPDEKSNQILTSIYPEIIKKYTLDQLEIHPHSQAYINFAKRLGISPDSAFLPHQQIKRVLKGKSIGNINNIVNNYMALELVDNLSFSAYDMDTIKGNTTADLAKGGEQMTLIGGEQTTLKAGDFINKVDGASTKGWVLPQAVSKIRGKKGTIVTLNIFREGWTSAKDFKITRDTIVVPTMKWEIKDSNIAYIRFNEFGETLPADFKTAALKILQSPAKKIILDLRGNPGGYLEAAQNIAGWFLKQGQTVTIEDFGKGKTQQIYKAEGNAELANYPVVILIDQGSASASEILAGALRDNRNIKLIGTKSFGKGSVQEVTNLRGGSFLKITIAKWLTPKGDSISEIGLEPDVKVEISDKDIEDKKDPQLDKALELINGMK